MSSTIKAQVLKRAIELYDQPWKRCTGPLWNSRGQHCALGALFRADHEVRGARLPINSLWGILLPVRVWREIRHGKALARGMLGLSLWEVFDRNERGYCGGQEDILHRLRRALAKELA